MFPQIFGFSSKPVVHLEFPNAIRSLVGNPKLTEAVDSLKTVLQNQETRQKYYEWSSAHRKVVCNNELLSQADRQVVKVTVLEWIDNDLFAEFSGSVYVNFRKFLNFFASLYVPQQTKIQDAIDKFESGAVTARQFLDELGAIGPTEEDMIQSESALLALPEDLLLELEKAAQELQGTQPLPNEKSPPPPLDGPNLITKALGGTPKEYLERLYKRKKNPSFEIFAVAPPEEASRPLKGKAYIANNNPRTVTRLRDEKSPPAWSGSDLRFYTSFRKILSENITDEALLNSFTVEIMSDNEELNRLLMPLHYRLPSCLFEEAHDGKTVRVQLGARTIELELDQSTAPPKFPQGTFQEVFAQIGGLLDIDDATLGFSPVKYLNTLQREFSTRHVTINGTEIPLSSEQLTGLISKAKKMEPHKDITHGAVGDQFITPARGLQVGDITYLLDSKANTLFVYMHNSHTENFFKNTLLQLKKKYGEGKIISQSESESAHTYMNIHLSCPVKQIAQIQFQLNEAGWMCIDIIKKEDLS